jgi:hypothetical protein
MNIFFSKILGVNLLVLAMLIGITTGAFGQGTGGGAPSSAASSAGAKGLLKLRATVVCANCSLEEARAAHPSMTDIYELSHEKGKVVIQVSSVNEPTDEGKTGDVSNRWTSINQAPQISVRAEDNLFQKLVDKRNLSKEIEITGIIRTTRTLDIADITVLG